MKRTFMVMVIVMVMAIGLTSCGAKKEMEELRKQLTDTEEQLELKEGELADTEKQLELKEGELDDTKKQLESKENELESLNNQVKSLKEESSSKGSELQSLKEELAQQVESGGDTADGQLLMELIFPVDGKSYVASQKVIFYKDVELSQKVGTGDQIAFVSKEQKEVTADKEKELKVWIARSESGLLFSANKPGIKEAKESK